MAQKEPVKTRIEKTDQKLQMRDKVRFKSTGRFKARTGIIKKFTKKRVIMELPSEQTTNRALHNLERA